MWFKNKVHEEIEAKVKELQMYLENNYKDLAIGARKEAREMIEKYYEEGKLKDKAYARYKELVGQYEEEMKGYNHQQFYRS